MNDELDFINKTTNSKLLLFKAIFESEIDIDDSIRYFKKAAELGEVNAMNFLGEHYCSEMEDNIREENDILANAIKLMKEYYSKVVKLTNGNIKAMIELGKVYEKEKDYDMMKRYYIQACEFDSYVAMEKLGEYYMEVEDKPSLMVK